MKIADATKLAVGGACDFVLGANGAITEEFEKDQLLTQLISSDLMQYPTFLSPKFQMAVCTSIDITKGARNGRARKKETTTTLNRIEQKSCFFQNKR